MLDRRCIKIFLKTDMPSRGLSEGDPFSLFLSSTEELVANSSNTYTLEKSAMYVSRMIDLFHFRMIHTLAHERARKHTHMHCLYQHSSTT